MARVLTKSKHPIVQARVVGFAKRGKTTLVAAACPPDKAIYVIPVDNRAEEYIDLVGVNRVIVPDMAEDAPWKLREPRLVLEEVRRDAEAGVFSKVGIVVIDSITPWYQERTRETLDDKLGGGKSSFVDKANAMKLALAIAQYPGLPYFIIWHEEEAGDTRGKMSTRESISQLESARLELGINMDIETIKGPNGEYGVKVSTRYRPGMKPLVLWDKPDNMFVGMMERINAALYDQPVPDDEPMTWDDFGKDKPFPKPEQGKTPKAVTLAAEHFVEFEGQKIYPFGDPNAVVTKKDGSEGTNGAMNHALNAYEVIRNGRSQDYPKPTNPGEFAEVWKKYVEDKISIQIEALKLAVTAEELGGQVVAEPEAA